MYPDWPESPTDLVPLPRCDGPKLEAFDFHGPQKIEFIEYLGEGTHSHVFKVKILGEIYALKLFRFVYDDDWMGPTDFAEENNLTVFNAFYDYSEPFSCECRAFGRLKEAGHEELAIKCFGYVLLDEEHERTLKSQFNDRKLEFNGSIHFPGVEDMRSRFLGRDGRAPPIRGIVKAFGVPDTQFRRSDARKILRTITRLQQLGMLHLDVAQRQLIDGKLCDFSTAVTTPHFLTTPELNPCLTPESISAIESETFLFSINDYWLFDDMVTDWNDDHENDPKEQVSFCVFSGRHGYGSKYDMRSTPSRDLIYTFVDPRLYDWRASAPDSMKSITGELERRELGTRTEGGNRREPEGVATKTRYQLKAKPPRWYYKEAPADFKSKYYLSRILGWEVKDGLIFPRDLHPV